MKNFTSYCFLLLSVCFFFTNCNNSFPEKRTAKYDNMQKLMEREFRIAKDPELNDVPTQRLLDARQYRDLKIQAMESLMTPVPGINWQERGPSNVGGRTRALWFDLSDAVNGYKKVWAGGVGGGLWYTNDITVASPTWTKVDDAFENLAITSIVQSSTNPLLMYFSTGEGWFNVDAVRGLGVWKSIDGGVTWARLNSTATFYFIQDLLIDNNGHLYASVRLNNQGAGSTGIHKSTDAGVSWAQVLTTPTASNNRGADMELAANGDIYVSMGTSGNNGGIYRSSFATNGANTGNSGTWTNITPNTVGTISAPANFWHRIELACAPSDGNILYALFQGFGSNDCVSIQQYNAGTNTWTVGTVPTIIDQGSNSIFTRSQAWYDLISAVNPTNANSLYIGGVDALRSDDGGQTWTQMSTWSLFNAPAFNSNQQVHADHHAIVYAPGSPSRAVWGTDGGIFYTANADITGAGNKPNYASKNSGYNVTQFYSGAIHPSTTNYFLAGAQDNGSHRFNSAGMNSTTEVTGGDGAFVHIDQDNASIQITSYVYNNYFVSTNGGSSFTSFFKNNRGDFINPTDYDNTANILYGGDAAGNYYRWTDPATNGADAQVAVTNFASSFIYHVTVSPITANRVYFGLGNGSVVMVDAANTGVSKTGTVIKTGTGAVSCIAIDPADENHMLVTYSNYGVTSVFETYNALAGSPTWTAVEGDLPDMPVRWAMFDPRNGDWALLATELGVWSTNDLNAAGTQWSPTNSGLANVRVDMLQYRSLDRTVLAVTHGRGLFTAVVPSSITPDINFSTSTTVATEQTTATTGCRNYRDYNVIMTIDNPPTGDATVTVNVQGGFTAIQGIDFEYTTTNFITPTNTFVFANGVTDPKTLIIRVYNDVEVESPETFTLNYTISGATDAQPGTGAQTHTVNISDNDNAPIAGSTNSYSIGSYVSNLSTATIFRSNEQKHRIQTLFRASEFNAAGLNTAANIESMIVRVVTKNSTQAYNGFTISLGNTAATDMNAGYAATTFTQVYSGNYSSVVGNNTFAFTTPFSWDGASNVVVQFCFDNAPAAADPLSDVMEGSTPFGVGIRPSAFSDFVSGGTAGCSLPASLVSDFRIRATFGVNIPGTTVASALTTRTEYLAPLNDLYIYNLSGEIVARVRNLSGDFECTDVVIDRAGIGTQPFWNNNPGNRLMDKTYRVVPTTNNPSGSYEITLYYTQAEVAAWEAATGQLFSTIELIKVENQISDVTPGNPTGGGIVEVVTPTRGTLGTNYTLTYTFNNGFSGFGAGIPGAVLPIRLIDLTGALKATHITLDWKTSSETNSKGFEIERSYDGLSFAKIGFIPAAGNSNSMTTYEFTDNNIPQESNYYRLKQFDVDNNFEYSKVILVKNVSIAKRPFSILQNPFQNTLDIQFHQAPNGKVQLRLMDITGKLLVDYSNHHMTDETLQINIADKKLPKGVYVLYALVNGKEYVEKLMKE